MKVFEDQLRKPEVGQEAQDFRTGDHSSLSDFKGSPIFLVFWKTL
jgi:hypothetical protein